MLKEGLIKSIVNEILKMANPTKMVLFGSSTRDDGRRDSDIDLALFGVSSYEAFLLKEELNEKVDTLKDIDVLSFETIKNKRLKENIERGFVIYERSIN